MRSLVPTTTVVLAAGWFIAMIFDLPVSATAVAMLSLATVCADATRRRFPARVVGIAEPALVADSRRRATAPEGEARS